MLPTHEFSLVKQVTITLPDSVKLSEQEIQALILNEVYRPVNESEVVELAGRPVPPEYVAEIRYLVALYFAERATRLVAFQESNSWSGTEMQEWLQQHMRKGL